MISADVAIVGGGLMGTWTAFFLRRRGRSVVVLDKGEVGAQASGVNFGNLRVQGRFAGQIPLSLRAQSLWERIGELIGEECEFESNGHLYVALEPGQRAKLEQYAADAAPHGLAVELLDAADVRRRWPYLSDRVVAASHSARDGTANPRLVTPAVARAAEALGAQILPRQRVLAIEAASRRFRLTTESGLVVEADQVVNAAGAWAGDFAAAVGESVPMFAAGPPQFVTEPVPHFIGPSVQAVDGTVIFRQVRRGNVVVAGYPRGPSDRIANRAPVQTAKTLRTMQLLAAMAPRLAGAHVIRVWSGIEGYIPDMLPVIGPSATTPGLIHAFGFCGHGFQLGPGVGEVLSELLVDGGTQTPLAPFAITRFAGELAVDPAKLKAEFDESMLRAAGAGATTR
ncbi:MAG: FAD-binding oxidoreductase [Alphaproteobacteria bacterium]|nr:FAD-binding oxidoreductase [Alphaproteobacteria bacterium]